MPYAYIRDILLAVMETVYDEIIPVEDGDADPYASAEDVMTVDDLPEKDFKIRRWHPNGKMLRLRVRGLDLLQQQKINVGCLVKNPKTQVWEPDEPLYCALTLREGVIAPRLNDEQAKSMRQHNPVIIGKLVKIIWLLSALEWDDVEQAAYARTSADLQSAPAAASDDQPNPTDD